LLPVVLARISASEFPLVNLTLRESTTDARLRDLLAAVSTWAFVLPADRSEPSLQS